MYNNKRRLPGKKIELMMRVDLYSSALTGFIFHNNTYSSIMTSQREKNLPTMSSSGELTTENIGRP